MNIHEHQAKEILKEFGAPVSNGIVLLKPEGLEDKIKKIETEKIVVKAQIHAGGRGKAGGVKLVSKTNSISEIKKMFGKTLVTHQTGPKGKVVNRVYIQEAYDIEKEFYISCLIDRDTAKIIFISSTEGGMDIESVSKKNPEKIVKNRVDLKKNIEENDIQNILKIFKLSSSQYQDGRNLVVSLYNIIVKKDASLIEINPLVITKHKKLICLDAKMNFDDNALYRQPDILKLRDLNEEEPIEIEASKNNLAYIKLDGSIGCMVNGAGLAMATMDIIKLYGHEPANFLDVGGGASKEQVEAAFKLILTDKKVKGILINIFGGIMRCDILAQGVVEAAKVKNIKIPIVVRLAGTNFEKGKSILDNSGLKILPADDLNDAAKKIVKAIK